MQNYWVAEAPIDSAAEGIGEVPNLNDGDEIIEWYGKPAGLFFSRDEMASKGYTYLGAPIPEIFSFRLRIGRPPAGWAPPRIPAPRIPAPRIPEPRIPEPRIPAAAVPALPVGKFGRVLPGPGGLGPGGLGGPPRLGAGDGAGGFGAGFLPGERVAAGLGRPGPDPWAMPINPRLPIVDVAPPRPPAPVVFNIPANFDARGVNPIPNIINPNDFRKEGVIETFIENPYKLRSDVEYIINMGKQILDLKTDKRFYSNDGMQSKHTMFQNLIAQFETFIRGCDAESAQERVAEEGNVVYSLKKSFLAFLTSPLTSNLDSKIIDFLNIDGFDDELNTRCKQIVTDGKAILSTRVEASNINALNAQMNALIVRLVNAAAEISLPSYEVIKLANMVRYEIAISFERILRQKVDARRSAEDYLRVARDNLRIYPDDAIDFVPKPPEFYAARRALPGLKSQKERLTSYYGQSNANARQAAILDRQISALLGRFPDAEDYFDEGRERELIRMHSRMIVAKRDVQVRTAAYEKARSEEEEWAVRLNTILNPREFNLKASVPYIGYRYEIRYNAAGVVPEPPAPPPAPPAGGLFGWGYFGLGGRRIEKTIHRKRKSKQTRRCNGKR